MNNTKTRMNLAFTFIAAMLFSLSANASKFTQDVHYRVLDSKVSKEPTISEYFSFYCRPCNSFEAVIQAIKAELPKHVIVEKKHVSFLGGKMGMVMSKAYATMLVLNVEDKMTPLLFNLVNNKDLSPKNSGELRQLFLGESISPKKFDDAYNSFFVESMAKRFDKEFMRNGLSGTPAIIINNKYLIEAHNIKTLDEYLSLVNYLLKKV